MSAVSTTSLKPVAAKPKSFKPSWEESDQWKCSNCTRLFPWTVCPRVPVHAYPGEYLCDHGTELCHHPDYTASLKRKAESDILQKFGYGSGADIISAIRPVAAAAASAAAAAPAVAASSDAKENVQSSSKKVKHHDSKWSQDEDDWLILSVCQNNAIPIKSKPVPWDVISRRVLLQVNSSVHDAKSCEARWSELYPVLTRGASRKWSVLTDHRLITAVYETGAEQYDEITWKQMVPDFPADVQAAFFKALCSKLPSDVYPWHGFNAYVQTLYDNMQSRLKVASIPDAEWHFVGPAAMAYSAAARAEKLKI